MIEMNGAVTGLITTAGHRDEIEIRRGYKESIWDPAFPPPIPIAPRRRRIGVPERLDFRGDGRDAARRGGRARAPCSACASRASSRSPCACSSPSSIRRTRSACARSSREEYPGVRVSLSHEVMPTAPEFERTSTTLVDAYVGPRVETLPEAAARRAARAPATAHDLLIMQSNGGIMTADFLAKRAVASLGSGPTGGVMGACAVAQARGRLGLHRHRHGRHELRGLPDQGRHAAHSQLLELAAPLPRRPADGRDALDRRGRRLDRRRRRRARCASGPRARRPIPGPICYGRGGTRPTVTDANLVLGYINPEALCGGEFKLTSAGRARGDPRADRQARSASTWSRRPTASSAS